MAAQSCAVPRAEPQFHVRVRAQLLLGIPYSNAQPQISRLLLLLLLLLLLFRPSQFEWRIALGDAVVAFATVTLNASATNAALPGDRRCTPAVVLLADVAVGAICQLATTAAKNERVATTRRRPIGVGTPIRGQPNQPNNRRTNTDGGQLESAFFIARLVRLVSIVDRSLAVTLSDQ
jgi:hypothetical protein